MKTWKKEIRSTNAVPVFMRVNVSVVSTLIMLAKKRVGCYNGRFLLRVLWFARLEGGNGFIS